MVQTRTLEAFLAMALILSAVLAFNSILPSMVAPPPEKNELTYLKEDGYEVLLELDEQGTLRELVYTEQWASLKSSLRYLLPIDNGFQLTVRDENGQPIKTMQDGSLEGNVKASILYVLGGYQARTEYRLLELTLVKVTS